MLTLISTLLAQTPVDPSASAASAVEAGIDPALAADLLLKGIESGNWWLILGPGLSLLVWALRMKVAPLYAPLDGFLQKPVPALLTPILTSLLAGLLTVLVAGPVTKEALLALLPSVLKVSFTAIATYVAVKKVAEQREQAHEKAKVTVPAVQDAVAELNKPPVQ